MPIVELFKALGIYSQLHKEESKKYFHQISEIFNIPRTNLYNWHNNLQKNLDWIPDHAKSAETSKVFTPEQFSKLQKMIEKIVESKNIPVKNKFIASVTNFYYHSLDYHPQPNLNFNASQHYIIKLKEGLNYSTRLCHPKRRPNCSSDEMIKFLKICKFIMTTSKSSHVLNVYESFFF